jgi:hypothetical protein
MVDGSVDWYRSEPCLGSMRLFDTTTLVPAPGRLAPGLCRLARHRRPSEALGFFQTLAIFAAAME